MLNTRRKFIKRSLIASGTIFLRPNMTILNVKPGISLLNARKILFLGDSITQQGHYVNYIEAYLRIFFPQSDRKIINLGLSSETASGLSEPTHPFPRPTVHERLEKVLELIKPDLTFAGYGINDGIYHPLSEHRFSAFQEGILKLKEKVAAAGSELILLTPAPYTAPINNPDQHPGTFGYQTPYPFYDDVMQTYGRWVHSLASDKIQVIDIQKPLRRFKSTCYDFDFIHPNLYGHFLIALEILKTTGFTIPTEMEAVNLTMENGQVVFETSFSPLIQPEYSSDQQYNQRYLEPADNQYLTISGPQNGTFQLFQQNSLLLQFKAEGNQKTITINPETLKDKFQHLQQLATGQNIMRLLGQKHEIYDYALLAQSGHQRPFDRIPLSLNQATEMKDQIEQELDDLIKNPSQQWQIIRMR